MQNTRQRHAFQISNNNGIKSSNLVITHEKLTTHKLGDPHTYTHTKTVNVIDIAKSQFLHSHNSH
jgi:hypothetical protein